MPKLLKSISSLVFPVILIWVILWFVYSIGDAELISGTQSSVVISKNVDDFIKKNILFSNSFSSTPKCTDPQTLDVLKKLLDESPVVRFRGDNGYKIENIATMQKSELGNSYICNALIKFPSINGDDRSMPLTYSVTISDSKQSFQVMLLP